MNILVMFVIARVFYVDRVLLNRFVFVNMFCIFFMLIMLKLFKLFGVNVFVDENIEFMFVIEFVI